MPYSPSERVNLRFVGDPETAVLQVEGLADGTVTYTAQNGGLELKSDGGLIAEFNLPDAPGDLAYHFFDAATASERGTLRVLPNAQPAAPTGLIGA